VWSRGREGTGEGRGGGGEGTGFSIRGKRVARTRWGHTQESRLEPYREWFGGGTGVRSSTGWQGEGLSLAEKVRLR